MKVVPNHNQEVRHTKHLGMVVLLSLAVLSGEVKGEAFLRYQQVGSLNLPAGAVMFDALHDGRIVTLTGDAIHVETKPGSGSFILVGSLAGADFPSFGAAFLRVSPDGTRFAVGNNGGSTFSMFRVGVFDVDDLSGVWFHAAHYDAAWVDDNRLALTAGEFGSPSTVTILDTDSPDPVNPDNRRVITGVGGASGGIAFDTLGNLFTGNGFTGDGPSGTGAIRAFPLSLWKSAYAGGPNVDFEVDGVLVADILSASPIGFDAEGNLLVGGGDFSEAGETDYIALIRSSAIAAALAGQGPADSADPTEVRKLDPDAPNDFNFFFTVANPALARIYAKDFSETTVHVYLDTSNVPAASTWGVVSLGLLTSIAGTLLLRRGSTAA